ncbi:sulfite reductase (NADPH) flavoprotein alpha-component [Luteimonas cucumeris]|uniref:NADPH--hemoprotein reductase n=1 Tax=Luteimonas cucumeris TaxID=985012 RepID=A0A562KYN3_9GAMM|nr:sulfite reductase flavoprotein subunit alpha [Luteimonas cucumeris]TWI00304.1 sulfite reductase (NADPH) flavoprotein alpha-component [Luteimonas cucumeris]
MSIATTRSARLTRAALGNAALLLALLALALAFLQLHDLDWFAVPPGRGRWLGAGMTLLAYAGFCGWMLRRPQARDNTTNMPADPVANGKPLLLAYASQTGFAQQLAERSARNLREAGLPVRLCDLGRLDPAVLAGSERALFLVSTTGEGDAPDPALAFVRDVLGHPASLHALRYGVLALGDREYDHFCGFGHALDEWLRHCGAQPLFDLVEVDNGDEGALRHWQHHLALLAEQPDLPDWTPPAYDSWRLLERRQLNPGTAGAAAFHISLSPPAATAPHWKAGDIAEIGPRNAPAAVGRLLEELALAPDAVVDTDGREERLDDVLARSHLPAAADVIGLDVQTLVGSLQSLPHREYSIASLPEDGSLQVLLRRMLRPDGSPGIGSGWLCDYAVPGSAIALRIRGNPNFHPPLTLRPLILVGNGTGIAGLRAHLKARIAAGAHRNWLLFGERNADRDFFFGDEILRWREQGFLQRLDLAFSRDPGGHRYVQDALAAAGDELARWTDDGAAIYVCGSLQGMAPGVDGVLRAVLGDDAVERLRIDGRYRRDVY